MINATVIINDKPAADAAIGAEYFTTELSVDGTSPATHWVASGEWDVDVFNTLINASLWKRVNIGDGLAIIAEEGLKIVEPVIEEPQTEEPSPDGTL